MGIDTWESRTRDLEEKKKGLAAKARNKELLESGTFKIVSHGTGKFGRVLGEVFVETDNGLQSVNQILIDEGHAYEYDGGKKNNKRAIQRRRLKMEKSKYSDFDNYTILCDNSKGFRNGYEYFLKFKEVKKFINQIANSSDSSDVVTHENNVYQKKITSAEAQNMLTSLFNNRCNFKNYKKVALQIGIRV